MQRKILRLFWQASQPYGIKRTFAMVFAMLAVITNSLVAPYILSQFLNKLQAGNVTINNSLPLILLYGSVLFVGDVVIWRIALYFGWTFEIQSMRDLYQRMFDRLAKQSATFHANRFGGALVSQHSKLIGAFERFWDMIIWSLVPMITMTFGAIITITLLGFWQYALALLFIAVCFASAVIVSSRFLRVRNTLEAQAGTKNTAYLADMVTNIMTVKSFGREQFESTQAKKVVGDWFEKSQHLKWGVITATSIYGMFLATINTAALFFAVIFASNNYLPVGTAYLLLIYSLNVGRQLWEMNSVVRTFSRVIGDAHDMADILDQPLEITDLSHKKLRVTAGLVTFESVAFAHDNGTGEQVFKKLNLTIPAGQRVGIVGHSGSGKTTLTRILLRFSDIQAGSILIDGQNITGVTQRSLHKAIAYVPQEPLLFHRSLRENIAYGKPTATDLEIKSVITQAHAEFVYSLPDGINTLVGERGVKLSGGQRQRIAIARAMLKDAPILVLDEATSALDSESERLIQESLGDLMKNRTSIVIAHRLSTIAKLDRIIVLDGGNIKEDGTHEQLTAAGGIYAKLWQHQSGGFIES